MTYCWRGGSLPEKVGDRDPQFVDRALTTRLERTAQDRGAGGQQQHAGGSASPIGRWRRRQGASIR